MKMSMFAKVAFFRLNRIYVLSALAYMFVFDWRGGGGGNAIVHASISCKSYKTHNPHVGHHSEHNFG